MKASFLFIIQVSLCLFMSNAKCPDNCSICYNGSCDVCKEGFTLFKTQEEESCKCQNKLYLDPIKSQCVAICSENYYADEKLVQCTRAPACSLTRIYGNNLQSDKQNQNLLVQKIIYINELNFIIGFHNNDKLLMFWGLKDGTKIYSQSIFGDEIINDISLYSLPQQTSDIIEQASLPKFLLIFNSQQNLFSLFELKTFTQLYNWLLPQQLKIQQKWAFKYFRVGQGYDISLKIVTINRFDGNINITNFASKTSFRVLNNTQGFIKYDLNEQTGNLLIFYEDIIKQTDLVLNTDIITTQCSLYNSIQSIDKIWRSQEEKMFIITANSLQSEIIVFFKDKCCQRVKLSSDIIDLYISSINDDNSKQIIIIFQNKVQIYKISFNNSNICNQEQGKTLQTELIQKSSNIDKYIFLLSIVTQQIYTIQLNYNTNKVISSLDLVNTIQDKSISENTNIKSFIKYDSLQFSFLAIIYDYSIRSYEISSSKPSSFQKYPPLIRYQQSQQFGFSIESRKVNFFKHIKLLDQQEYLFQFSNQGQIYTWNLQKHIIYPEIINQQLKQVLEQNNSIQEIQYIDQNNMIVFFSEGTVISLDRVSLYTQSIFKSTQTNGKLMQIVTVQESNSTILIYEQAILMSQYNILQNEFVQQKLSDYDSSDFIYGQKINNANKQILLCYKQQYLILEVSGLGLKQIFQSQTPFQIIGCQYDKNYNSIIFWSNKSYNITKIDNNSIQNSIQQLNLAFPFNETLKISTYCNKSFKLISNTEFLCLVQLDHEQYTKDYDLLYYVDLAQNNIKQILKADKISYKEIIHFSYINQQTNFVTFYLTTYQNFTKFQCQISQYVLDKKSCQQSCFIQFQYSYFPNIGNLDLKGNCNKLFYSKYLNQFLMYSEVDGILIESSILQNNSINQNTIQILDQNYQGIYLLSKLFMTILSNSNKISIYSLKSLQTLTTVQLNQDEKLIQVCDLSETLKFFILTNMRIIRFVVKIDTDELLQEEKLKNNLAGLILYKQKEIIVGYGENLVILKDINNKSFINTSITELNDDHKSIVTYTYSRLECIGIQQQNKILCIQLFYKDKSLQNLRLFVNDVDTYQEYMKVEKLDLNSFTKMMYDPDYRYVLIYGSIYLNIYSVDTGVLIIQKETANVIRELLISKRRIVIITEILMLIFDKQVSNQQSVTSSFVGSYLGCTLIENLNIFALYTTNNSIGPYIIIDLDTSFRVQIAIPYEKLAVVSRILYDEVTNYLYVLYDNKSLQVLQLKNQDQQSEWKILFHPIFNDQTQKLINGFLLDRYQNRVYMLSTNYLAVFELEKELSNFSNNFKSTTKPYSSFQNSLDFQSYTKYFLDFDNSIWIQKGDKNALNFITQEDKSEKIIHLDVFNIIDSHLMVYKLSSLRIYQSNGDLIKEINLSFIKVFKVKDDKDAYDIQHIIITRDSNIMIVDDKFSVQTLEKPQKCKQIIESYFIKDIGYIFLVCNQFQQINYIIYFFKVINTKINQLFETNSLLISVSHYQINSQENMIYFLQNNGVVQQLNMKKVDNEENLTLNKQFELLVQLKLENQQIQSANWLNQKLFIAFVNNKNVYIIDFSTQNEQNTQLKCNSIISQSSSTKKLFLNQNYIIIFSNDLAYLYINYKDAISTNSLTYNLKDFISLQPSSNFQNYLQLFEKDLVFTIDSAQVCLYQIQNYQNKILETSYIYKIICYNSTLNNRFYEKQFFIQNQVFLKVRLIFDNTAGQIIIKDILLNQISQDQINKTNIEYALIPNLSSIDHFNFPSNSGQCIHQFTFGNNIFEVLQQNAFIDESFQTPYLELYVSNLLKFHQQFMREKQNDITFRGIGDKMTINYSSWQIVRLPKLSIQNVQYLILNNFGSVLLSSTVKQYNQQDYLLQSDKNKTYFDFITKKERNMTLVENTNFLMSGREAVNLINIVIKNTYFDKIKYFFEYKNMSQINIQNLVIDNCVFQNVEGLFFLENIQNLNLKSIQITNNYIYSTQFNFFMIKSSNIVSLEYFNITNNNFILNPIFKILIVFQTFLLKFIGNQFNYISYGNISNNTGVLIMQFKKEIEQDNQQIVKQKDQLVFNRVNITNNTNLILGQTSPIKQVTLFELSSSWIQITWAIVEKNICYHCDGSIFIGQSQDVLIKNSIFIMNEAYNGGAFSFDSIIEQVRIYYSSFLNNIAMFSGGAIYCKNSDIQLVSDNIFQYNIALIGGAIRQVQKFSLLTIGKKDIDRIFQNNTGYMYGDNIGFYPIRLELSLYIQESKLLLQKDDLLSYKTYKSGQLIDFQVKLYDIYDQTLKFTTFKESKYYSDQQSILETEFQSYTLEIVEKANSVIQLDGSKIIDSLNSFDPNLNSFIFKNIQLSGLFMQCGDLIIQSDLINIELQSQIISKEISFNKVNKTDLYSAKTNFCFRSCNTGEIPKFLYQNYYICSECQEGTYSKQDFSSSFNNSTRAFSYNQDMKCKKCPEGATSCKGNQIVIADGYWRRDEDSEKIFSCSNNKIHCKGDLNSEQKNYCTQGYFGPLCESCDTFGISWVDRYFPKDDRTCQICNQSHFIYAMTILYAVIFTIYFKMNVYIQYRSQQKNSLCYYMRQLKLLPFSSTQYTDLSASLTKSLVHYLQISVIFEFQSFQIPPLFQGALGFFSNPSLWLSYSLDCLIPQTFSDNLLILRLMIVLNIPVILLLTQWIILACQVVFKQFTSHKAFLSVYTSTFLIVAFYSSNVTRYYVIFFIIFQKYLQMKLKQLLFLIPLYYSFLAENLGCKVIGDELYFLFDPKIKCIQKIENWYVISWFILIFWSCFPLIVALKMRKVRHQLHTTINKYKYGFFYLDFNPNYYYWETIRTFLRVSLVVACKLLQAFVNVRRVVEVAMILSYLFIVSKRKIFRNKILQRLEEMLLKIIITQITSEFIVSYDFYLVSQALSTIMKSIHYCFITFCLFLIFKHSLLSVNINQYPFANKIIRFLLPFKIYSFLINNVFVRSNLITLKRWKRVYNHKNLIKKLNTLEVYNALIYNKNSLKLSDNYQRNRTVSCIKRENTSIIEEIKSKMTAINDSFNKHYQSATLQSKLKKQQTTSGSQNHFINSVVQRNTANDISINGSINNSKQDLTHSINKQNRIIQHNLNDFRFSPYMLSKKPSAMSAKTDQISEQSPMNEQTIIMKSNLQHSNKFQSKKSNIGDESSELTEGIDRSPELNSNLLLMKEIQNGATRQQTIQSKKFEENLSLFNLDQFDPIIYKSEDDNQDEQLPESTHFSMVQRSPYFKSISSIQQTSNKIKKIKD